MIEFSSRPGLPGPLRARPIVPSDRPALDRLWLLFRHDLSAWTGTLPFPDGRYRDERLESSFTDPTWCGRLLTAGDHPIGFALVRALDRPVRVLNSFFLVQPVRRRGLGAEFASAVLAEFPGRWEVAYQEDNRAAAGFWPVVAARFDPDWAHEKRPVPGRPDLVPDSWLSFRVRADIGLGASGSHIGSGADDRDAAPTRVEG